MSLLDNRVCEDDINRVNAVRHHPKYEPGFEEESREEKVWYERDRNGLPNGYYLFSEVQEQYDNWQRQQIKRANMTVGVGGSIGGTVGGKGAVGGLGGAVGNLSGAVGSVGSSKVDLSKGPIETETNKISLWDSLWDWIYKKVNAWVDKI